MNQKPRERGGQPLPCDMKNPRAIAPSRSRPSQARHCLRRNLRKTPMSAPHPWSAQNLGARDEDRFLLLSPAKARLGGRAGSLRFRPGLMMAGGGERDQLVVQKAVIWRVCGVMAGVGEAGDESAKLCGRRCHARPARGWPAAACGGEHRAPGTHGVMRALGASASLILRSAGQSAGWALLGAGQGAAGPARWRG
jgi:hypothetical protein